MTGDPGDALRTAVMQAIGAASVAWIVTPDGERVFDTERAIEIADGLCREILGEPEADAPGALPGRADRGACRGCGSQVAWVLTHRGRRMPLDPEPQMRVVLTPARPGSSDTRAAAVATWVPHFATCPAAEQFRKAIRVGEGRPS